MDTFPLRLPDVLKKKLEKFVKDKRKEGIVTNKATVVRMAIAEYLKGR